MRGSAARKSRAAIRATVGFLCALCLAVTMGLGLAHGGTPERDIFVKVMVKGGPTGPDTVLVSSRNVMPPNVTLGQQDVPAYRFTFKRLTSQYRDPIYLTSMKFHVELLDGSPLNPSDVIYRMRAEVLGTPQAGTALRAELRGTTEPPVGLLELELTEPALLPMDEGIGVYCYADIQPETNVRAFKIKFDNSSMVFDYGGAQHPVVVLSHEGGPGTEIYATTTVIPGTLNGSFTNYPNPFAAGREVTTFTYFLPRQAEVSLRLFTGFGRLVKTLESGTVRAGAVVHEDVQWDGTDTRGARVQNGAYFAVLSVRYPDGSKTEAVRKVAVLR